MLVASYQDLLVWRRAMDLTEEVYRLGSLLPKSEQFGITGQVLRAAVSVPANIAEGHARSGPREFLSFLSIAGGSLAETETLLMLAVRTGMLSSERTSAALAMAEEVSRMLGALKRRLKANLPAKRSPSP